MFSNIFCDLRRVPISPSQLGLLWRCRGAPGCSQSAPKTALDALRAVTSAAPKPILAKEACRYATHGQNSCEKLEFSKYLGVSAEKFRFLRCFSIFFVFFWLMSISPPQLGLLWRCRAAPVVIPQTLRASPDCSWMLQDALWAAPAVPPEPILAKEARRYASYCQNCCRVGRFLK